MARWKDKDGKTLKDFPQPTLAVDIALLTVPEPFTEDSRVHVLLHRRSDGFASGNWALPGTLVRKKERLSGAVTRALRIKTGVTGVEPVQLGVFDDPDRDARGWVLTVAHAGLLPYQPLAAAVSQSPDVTLA